MGLDPITEVRTRSHRTRSLWAISFVFVLSHSMSGLSLAQCFTVTLPQVGEREFCLTQTGPEGGLIAPEGPAITPFRPPSIFSAPLPSGSGARALGLAGAFTAVADDATAASWNPAGLVRLERPEASVVFRYAQEEDEHHVTDPSINVGEDRFDNVNLNYFSLVYPFQRKVFDRNLVISLNYQEAYDFAQRFTANFRDQAERRMTANASDTFSAVTVERVTDGLNPPQVEHDLTIRSRTDVTTDLDQRIINELEAEVDFKQEGIIDAITPAIAIEITRKLFFGASLNVYQDSPLFGNDIRTDTHAHYTGTSNSDVASRTKRTLSGSYTFEGVLHVPIEEGEFVDVEVEGAGVIEPVVESSSSNRTDLLVLNGLYEESSMFDDLYGVNATLGILWNATRHLTLGASIDLPWTAKAEQRRWVRQELTTFDASRTRVLDESTILTKEIKDIEFEFPLFWSMGALWRWTSYFYTSFDVSQTLWSDFSFKAEGETRINPLDGSPHSENPLDDTWSVRLGAEYLVVGRTTEIPLRAGMAWEQRPALGEPDDFYLFTVGSGIAFGKDPDRTILDFAYVLTHANDVNGVIPEQADLTSNVTEHQVILSFIQHF